MEIFIVTKKKKGKGDVGSNMLIFQKLMGPNCDICILGVKQFRKIRRAKSEKRESVIPYVRIFMIDGP